MGHPNPSPAASGYASTHTGSVEMLVPGCLDYMGPAFVSPTASGFKDHLDQDRGCFKGGENNYEDDNSHTEASRYIEPDLHIKEADNKEI